MTLSAREQLKQRILNEGRNLGDGILKIDSILNHQIDTRLIIECGAELAAPFAHLGITRVLTAEVSGIAPGMAVGYALNVPVVYARKTKPVTMFGPIFLETAPSHTKGVEVNLMVALEFMPPNEKVLIVDDFLASGRTLHSLVRITQEARCDLMGIACVVEKVFEGGRTSLSKYRVPIETLVQVVSMDNGKIILGNE
jgi:xanthine phosphoribosyltransferase